MNFCVPNISEKGENLKNPYYLIASKYLTEKTSSGKIN